MEHLKLFHRDVLTVRSHQWKYYVEPYSGCALQCTYCLYWESPAFVERLHPPEDLLPGVERDLAAMPKRQIVYIGSTIDPYQMLEKKVRATRQILERLVRRELPVVILTKSPLILRDLDLLLELNRRGSRARAVHGPHDQRGEGARARAQRAGRRGPAEGGIGVDRRRHSGALSFVAGDPGSL